MTDLDDPEGIERADPSGMLRTILGLADQCREGYELAHSVRPLPDAASLASIVVCGMGGSGVAGDMVRALYRDRLTIPLDVVKEASLPEYCGRDTLVVCSSFSGNTAETLACLDAASARGCRVIAVASGGELARRASERGAPVVSIPPGPPAPRAALGLLLGATLGALDAMGIVPPALDDLEEAVEVLRKLAGELDPAVRADANPAKDVARWIGERVPVVWGAEGLGAVAAVRWKTELNENAKTPSFASSLPELDHNEVVGWSKGTGTSFALIALRHRGEPNDVAMRFPTSMDLAAEAGLEGREVWASGESSLARVLSLVMLGGAASVYLGVARGFDPTPIEAIDRLKRVLQEQEP